MRKGEEKSFLGSTPVLIFLSLLVLVMLFHAVRSYYLLGRARKEETELTSELHARSSDLRDMQAKLRKLQSGEGVDLEARSRLNLQKPDEKVLIIVSNDGKHASSTPVSTQSIFLKIKDFLKNIL